jgi:hypothetical protein
VAVQNVLFVFLTEQIKNIYRFRPTMEAAMNVWIKDIAACAGLVFFFCCSFVLATVAQAMVLAA